MKGKLLALLLALKERAESLLKSFEWTWTTAVLLSVALSFFALISMAVLPSAWLYYADQKLKWDGSTAHKLVLVEVSGFWLKELRDAVAMGLTTGPFVTILVLAAVTQNWRRKLRGATSEARPSGGYR